MNAQNFTQKTLEAVQTAQAMAQENNNNYIMPEHLLYALIDQDGGLIPSLLGKMGVDCNLVLSELDSDYHRRREGRKVHGRRVHLRGAPDDRHLRLPHRRHQADF